MLGPVQSLLWSRQNSARVWSILYGSSPVKISASIVFAAVFPICCGESPRVITAEAPLKSVEIYGAMAIADLRSGVAARTVVGPNLFGDFEPGVRPEAIETRFGRAADVVTRGDDLTLFIYERQGQRVAVVRQIVTGSSGGPKGTSYHLEAYPPPHFEETLPQALQDVIRSSS